MSQEHVLRDFAALPRPAQQLVVDFIAFLRTRYAEEDSSDLGALPDLSDEAFVGMWRDRADMADTVEWVRSVRRREWS